MTNTGGSNNIGYSRLRLQQTQQLKKKKKKNVNAIYYVKEGTYLFDQTTIVNTIHIYENAMVRRLSLRLNIAASATATEIIIIII